MATTTQRQVYINILSTLHASADADAISVHKDYIYLTPIPVYSQSDDKLIQLIPGTPTIETDIAGIGYAEEDFRVAVWARCFLDQINRSTEKVTNATYGVMATMNEVRQSLIQSTAGGVLTTPILWVNGSHPVESEDAVGWVYYEDTYRMGFEITWG
jgi:hypothetical protein